MKKSRRVIGRRKRLVRMCRNPPEVDDLAVGHRNEHVAFRVRKKTFASSAWPIG
jgi:hypothetical protein